MKKGNSIKSIQRMIEISRGHALVPRNLDMSKFGDKKDKVALIFDRVYSNDKNEPNPIERIRPELTDDGLLLLNRRVGSPTCTQFTFYKVQKYEENK